MFRPCTKPYISTAGLFLADILEEVGVGYLWPDSSGYHFLWKQEMILLEEETLRTSYWGEWVFSSVMLHPWYGVPTPGSSKTPLIHACIKASWGIKRPESVPFPWFEVLFSLYFVFLEEKIAQTGTEFAM